MALKLSFIKKKTFLKVWVSCNSLPTTIYWSKLWGFFFFFGSNLMLLWTDSCGFKSWPLNSHAHWYRLPWWELHFLLDFVSEITLWHHSFPLSLKGINETCTRNLFARLPSIISFGLKIPFKILVTREGGEKKTVH